MARVTIDGMVVQMKIAQTVKSIFVMYDKDGPGCAGAGGAGAGGDMCTGGVGGGNGEKDVLFFSLKIFTLPSADTVKSLSFLDTHRFGSGEESEASCILLAAANTEDVSDDSTDVNLFSSPLFAAFTSMQILFWWIDGNVCECSNAGG